MLGNVEYDVFPVKLAMDQGITRLIAFQNTAYMFGLTGAELFGSECESECESESESE